MENLNVSPAVSLIGPQLGDRDSRYRLGIPAYLRGREGVMLAMILVGAIGFFAGWQWFGSAAVLPLLYTLPCAVMMAMCMRGHGGTGNATTTSNGSVELGPDI